MATSDATRTTSWERDLLAQLVQRWGRRVAVKRDELDLDGHFDPARPDFPDRLVPVLDLPGVAPFDPAERDRVRSAAWISYNAKTSAIEEEVILPACRLLLAGRVPVRTDDAAVAALHQTIIDEHYHILMCHNAVGVTRRRRDLAELGFPAADWAVVRGRDAYRASLTDDERDLADVAFALAAETTISGFLSALATADEIQPMNRLTVDLHRRDESGHAVVFRELTVSMYRELDATQRDLFADALVHGLAAFRAPDVEPWLTVARTADRDIDPELLRARTGGRPVARDTGPLRLLLADLGLTESLARLLT